MVRRYYQAHIFAESSPLGSNPAIFTVYDEISSVATIDVTVKKIFSCVASSFALLLQMALLAVPGCGTCERDSEPLRSFDEEGRGLYISHF